MNVLVDTSIWSLFLRRSRWKERSAIVNELEELVGEMRVEIIGPIRQEILSGIKIPRQFMQLRNYLRSFVDLPISTKDYERAAEIFNACRSIGVQGSNTDFLICAVTERRGLAFFTTDKDFERYSSCCRIGFYRVR